MGLATLKPYLSNVLPYLWLPCCLISLFVLTPTALLLWRLIPFPHFIASPLLFPLFYVTHPLYSCATNTDLYPLTPVSLLSQFLPLSYSFPCAPVSQFSLRPLLQFSSQLSLFPCLTVFPCSPVSQFSLFPSFWLALTLFLIWTQVALVMCTFC